VNRDMAFVWVARSFGAKSIRPDHAITSSPWTWTFARPWAGWVAVVGLALIFVVIGAVNLDLGPAEARLGLAAGGRVAPLGQVFGYWAPDLWPAEVLPSLLLGRVELGGRPSSAAVRWPAAIAGICAGWLVARRLSLTQGVRAAVMFGVCWFSSLGLMDRSAWTGLDLILGLATLGAIDRITTRGADWVAGIWLALSFLAGGWPPLVLVGLAVIAAGKKVPGFSMWSLSVPILTIVVWSVWTLSATSAEVWAAALTLPLTGKPAWFLGPAVLAAGLPWSPLAILVAGRSVRECWRPDALAWAKRWLQVGAIALAAGTLVPGLASSAGALVMASLCVAAAAGLDAAWSGSLGRGPRIVFFAVFAAVVAIWLVLSIYGSFLWSVTMPFYRTLGVGMGLMVLLVGALAWWSLETWNTRRALFTLLLVAVGLKLVHWGYYVPEWNYRHSQGPWARAIAQWVPRKWTLYTLHDWPPDLAFFMKRPARQLTSPHHLPYQPGPTSKFVLLLPSEFDNWPASAPPISVVVRLLDQWGGERIVARTSGPLPPPFGPGPPRLATARDPIRR
jgi:hypothetical protein